MDSRIRIFLLIINILSFALMAYDKQQAKKHKVRIAESVFMLLGIFGGFVGILSAMHIFRHKTVKRSFHFKILVSLLSFNLLVYLYLRYIYS